MLLKAGPTKQDADVDKMIEKTHITSPLRFKADQMTRLPDFIAKLVSFIVSDQPKYFQVGQSFGCSNKVPGRDKYKTRVFWSARVSVVLKKFLLGQGFGSADKC